MNEETNLNDPKKFKATKILAIIGKIVGLAMIIVPIVFILLLVTKLGATDSTMGIIFLVVSVLIGIYLIKLGANMFKNSKVNGNRDILKYVKSPRFIMTIIGLALVTIGAIVLIATSTGGSQIEEANGIAVIAIIVIGAVLLSRRKYYCEWCGAKMKKGELVSSSSEIGNVTVSDSGRVNYSQTTTNVHRWHCTKCDYWREIAKTKTKRK